LRGRLNDGLTSTVHEVHLTVDPDAGLLRFEPVREGASAPEPWPLRLIRLIERTKTVARLTVEGRDGTRLAVDLAAREFLALHCPDLGRRARGYWSGGRVALWSVLSLGGLCLTLFVLLPLFAHQVARILPASIERGLT